MDRDTQKWHESLTPEGMVRLRDPRRCKRCRTMNKLVSKRHGLQVCFHCVKKEERTVTSVLATALLMATAALLLVVCVGCQTPREMRVDARVAGQEIKCEIRR